MTTQKPEAKTTPSIVKLIVANGLGIALVFVAAIFVHIRVPIAGAGGMIHLGDLPLFVFALLYGRKTGALAGAFGLTLFDLMAGWTLWAPFTFAIAGAAGWLVGLAGEKNPEGKAGKYAYSIIAANLVTIAGYYAVEGLLYGNWLAPVASVPVNFLQVTVAAVLALPIANRLKKLI
ncbi:MAG: ECF transporter S component [Clostridiales bacterium]|nr:ECF transporter S component [Clostridiales bacterium]